MQNTQEYLSENSQRNYPFRASINGVSPAVPKGFILTLRLFITGDQETTAWLSEIIYTQNTDSYKLTFSNAAGVILDGDISRLDSGSSRNAKKSVIGSGQKVCIFTTGDLWDSPSWNEEGNWTITITEAGGLVEPACLLPGPATLRRIIIDGIADPLAGIYPKNVTQSIKGGYNVSLSLSNNLYLIENDGSITIEAGNGLGLGSLPLEEVDVTLCTINGVGPDSNGNVNLTAEDCLRVLVPMSGGQKIENTLQIESDCMPCCPCESYQRMSKSIERRANDIQSQCESIAATQLDAAVAYGIGDNYIKANKRSPKQTPLVIARDIMVDKNTITFTIQNISNYSLYPYMSVTLFDSNENAPLSIDLSVASPLLYLTANTSNNSFEGSVNGKKAVRAKLKNGQGSDRFPTNIDNNKGTVLQIGYPSQSDATQNNYLREFRGGDSCAIKLTTGEDIRVNNRNIKIRSVAIVGKDLQYSFLGHSIIATITGSGDSSSLAITKRIPEGI